MPDFVSLFYNTSEFVELVSLQKTSGNIQIYHIYNFQMVVKQFRARCFYSWINKPQFGPSPSLGQRGMYNLDPGKNDST